MTRQSRISAWALMVLGEKAATDIPERALRTAEEALELAQACDVDVATAHRLVDYVFSRPVGKPAQEIAGCMVTLYAMAAALKVDADEEFEKEADRIHRPEIIERCQRRQHEKREALVAEPKETARDQRWTVVGLYERGKYVLDTFICYVSGVSAEEAKTTAVTANANRGDRIEVLACVAGGGVAHVFQDDHGPTRAEVFASDLTKHETFSLSYLTPNLMSVLEHEPPKAVEETRRLARQELAWLLRYGSNVKAQP